KQTQEYFDLHSCVELLDVKSIIPNSQAYIQLVDYGYLQLMEITIEWIDTLMILNSKLEMYFSSSL
ncbi:hypothetical protein QM421_08960, partial [Streptococcus infantis]